MADDMFRQISKNTWYKVSIYVNIILFLIIVVFLYYLVIDCISYGRAGQNAGDTWLYVTRDIAFISVALALIFFQFIRNLYIILRRSL